MAEKTDRRGFLNKTLLGAAGIGAAASLEENILLAAAEKGRAAPQSPKPEIDPTSMPCGKIGRFHDNMWCLDAEKTAAFMHTVEKPWVAFKVMAAGAIHPQMAFSFAYRNGADFIVAGMFDFHVEQDAKIAINDVPKFKNRARPWRG